MINIYRSGSHHSGPRELLLVKMDSVLFLQHVMDRLSENAAQACGLSKRPAQVLGVMGEGAPQQVYSNQCLVDILSKYHLSAEASLAKDASTVKSHLIEAGCLRWVGKASSFALTDVGQQKASAFYDSINTSLATSEPPDAFGLKLIELLEMDREEGKGSEGLSLIKKPAHIETTTEVKPGFAIKTGSEDQ